MKTLLRPNGVSNFFLAHEHEYCTYVGCTCVFLPIYINPIHKLFFCTIVYSTYSSTADPYANFNKIEFDLLSLLIAKAKVFFSFPFLYFFFVFRRCMTSKKPLHFHGGGSGLGCKCKCKCDVNGM